MLAARAPGLALVALALAASVGSAVHDLGSAEALTLWARDLEPGDPAGVASNALGEAFLAGTVHGSIALWKLDPLGEPVWRARAPAALANGVAALPDGGAVVAGLAWGQGPDALLVAFDAEGRALWARSIATPEPEQARAVAAGPRSVYAVGTIGHDLLVARFELDGTPRWTRRLGGAQEEVAESAAVLPDGSVAVAGWSYDGTRNRGFVMVVEENGVLRWQRELAAPDASLRGHGVSASPLGELLLAGVRDTVLEQRPLAARLDALGALAWLRSIDEEPGASARSVAADAAGGAVLLGTAPGRLGGTDWLLARLTADGELAWSKRVDAGSEDEGRGVAILPSGLLTAAGEGSGRMLAARFLDLPARPH